MARLPFDPDRIELPRPEPPARPPRPMTVSEVASMIRDALAQTPQRLRVVGEVSNFTSRSHWFFSIKDASAALRCVCFASVARRIGTQVKDGMEVVATGRLDFYDAQGHVQLYVEAIEPVGAGALEMKFRELCEQLRREGYFDEERKRAIPLLPRRVAVITSRSAAALQDVVNTTRQRWPACRLLLYDVRVQGDAAADEIARAIEDVSAQGDRLGIDVVILTRGGGSIEDLWSFNERIVADAVHQCRIPVVAAIGHETDTTIAELVADLRCATPTQAAVNVVPDQAALMMQLRQYEQRLGTHLKRHLESCRQQLRAIDRHELFRRPRSVAERAGERLARLTERLAVAARQRAMTADQRLARARHDLAAVAPSAILRLARSRVAELEARMRRGARASLERRRERIDAFERQLRAVGPGQVLARGYSYTLGRAERLLRSTREVATGEPITTVLVDGRIRSRVIDATAAESSPAEERRESKPDDEQTPSGDQLDLLRQ